MKINYPLLEATFIDRPNRFITRVKLNGIIINSHLPDPGRLTELLVPGAKLLLKKEQGKNRKTSFSTQAVYHNGILISLNTLLPNKYVEYLLINNKLDFLKNWTILKKEVVYNNHRFDFKLQNQTNKLILEIKSVSLVENSIAKFPDSITLRGKKHVEMLGKLSENGEKTMVLFVIQRSDAKQFEPHWNIDPKFSNSLYESWNKGMEVKVINMKMTKNKIYYKGEIPFNLNKTL